MNKYFFFVANWKMSFDFNQSIQFVKNNYEQLITLSNNEQVRIVLCPSMPALHALATSLKETHVFVGAQDCSNEKQGAFTGQVSACHLKTSGATYCIIGHSERRKYNYETDEEIAQKCLRLLEQGVTPVICIGENLEEFQARLVFQVLEKQLQPIISLVNQQVGLGINNSICLAYEPVWSIGTGVLPQQEDLANVFDWLYKKTQGMNALIDWKLLYGGSVKSNNAAQLAKIAHIDGFLIGGASLDFQELEKIVHYSLDT